MLGDWRTAFFDGPSIVIIERRNASAGPTDGSRASAAITAQQMRPPSAPPWPPTIADVLVVSKGPL